ncbi:zinc finger protein-like [Tropilaelaps mercedesae]|uniref:Zinc finger protein-like n=1 Tax=Tropilaelaps mercedesae TaxID=418985 RepID=A0A1V9XG41_9ACAR|nr:zinc finger protein-like [Tropilaelaps mercedesae]
MFVLAEAAIIEELEKSLEALSAQVNIDDLSPGFSPISPGEAQPCPSDVSTSGASRENPVILNSSPPLPMETDPELMSTPQNKLETESATMGRVNFPLPAVPVQPVQGPLAVQLAEAAGKLPLVRSTTFTLVTSPTAGNVKLEILASPVNLPSCSAGQSTPRTFEMLPFKPSDVGRTVCEFCQRDFVYPARLLRHRRIHTGERPFKCEFCSKSFTQKVHLKLHTRVHTGERPFKCHRCTYAACDVSALRKHIAKHNAQDQQQQPHKLSESEAQMGPSTELRIGRDHKCAQAPPAASSPPDPAAPPSDSIE